MKITIYTIADCQFSKAEKEYLASHSLQYEEKNLETNKDFLTEMLAVSNNFAGTPVTRVEKDDGTIAVLKGFTKEEFDTTFGLTSISTTTNPDVQTPNLGVSTTDPTVPPQANDTPIPPVVEVPPAVPETVSPAPAVENPQPVNPLTNELNNESPISPDPLKSVMNDLQAKSQPTEVQPTIPPVANPTSSSPPVIPEPDFK